MFALPTVLGLCWCWLGVSQHLPFLTDGFRLGLLLNTIDTIVPVSIPFV